jgi:two-component system, OmpR family, catabolic regulation response regulator CreB
MKSPSVSPRILIVEDEPSITDTIQFPLESDGCVTECCTTGSEALTRLAERNFDLIVLDVGLPDMSGFEVCRRIRTRSGVPIVFLTARGEEIDQVVGLEIGGDDYVSKPFRPRELSARIRAILRRGQLPGHPASSEASSTCSTVEHTFAIDNDRKVIRYFGQPLTLSRYEFRLLEVLVAAPGRVYSRAQLMTAAWEEPEASMERTVDAHIKSLRAKLRLIRPDLDAIQTHRGFGYSLSEHL